MNPPNADHRRTSSETPTDWPVSRRAVLKTSGLASGTLLLGTETGQVAAKHDGRRQFNEGVPVVDGDDPDPDRAIVINALDVPIRDWTVYGTETVADHNPSYDAEDRVVVVAFEHRLDSNWPTWRRRNPDALFDGVVDRGIKFHAFPGARLEAPGAKNR